MKTPPANPLWRTDTHQSIWMERWCDRCAQPEAALGRHDLGSGCPILNQALKSGRKPREWDRMPNAQTMDSTIKCNEFITEPASIRRPAVEDETLAMFDVTPIAPEVDHQ